MAEKIVIVDDEKEIADVVELYLKNEDYEVHKFYNGKDTLAFLEKEEPDLAILDGLKQQGCNGRVTDMHNKLVAYAVDQ